MLRSHARRANPSDGPDALGAFARLLLLLSIPLQAQPAAAQLEQPVERGREELQDLRQLDQPSRKPLLPLPPPPPPRAREGLSGIPAVLAREFLIVGNTVFSDDELATVVAPWLGRQLSSEDLHAVRDALTLHYLQSGYVNSGAVLPDQQVSDGVVEYRIIEGHLTEVGVTGNRWFRDRYLVARVESPDDRPLRVDDLENRLQLLLQDDRLRRVNARLDPGARRGEAALAMEVEEAPPWRLRVEFGNDESPSIGSERGRLYFAHRNLTGFGDELSGMYSLTEGLDDVEARYTLPITTRDTRLRLRFTHSDSEVVEEPFDRIGIESRSVTYEIGVVHPVIRTLDSELLLGLSAEWRESRTYIEDIGRFSFSSGAENGKSRVSVLRFSQDWTWRDQRQVMALRSKLSWGLDAFGATVQKNSIEDGQFLAWLGQFQWARRFEPWDVQAVLRADVQLASEPLLPLEQFSVGGASSVRGYRENQLVRDMGFVTSLEVRIPLWRARDGRPILQLAPFWDLGRAWNTRRDTQRPKTLSAAGIGLRFSPTRRLRAELYWGEEIREVDDDSADRNLQDTGIHFRVALDVL